MFTALLSHLLAVQIGHLQESSKVFCGVRRFWGLLCFDPNMYFVKDTCPVDRMCIGQSGNNGTVCKRTETLSDSTDKVMTAANPVEYDDLVALAESALFSRRTRKAGH